MYTGRGIARMCCIGSLVLILSFSLLSCGGGGGGAAGQSGPKAPPSTGALKLNTGTSRAYFTGMKSVFNNTGRGVVVWTVMTGLHSHVLWAYFDGAVLQPEAELSVGGAQPDVATNGTDFMILWNNGGLIYSAPCSSAGVLGSPVLLSSAGGFDPQIASNGSGYAAAWSGYDAGSGEYRIHTNIYSASSWTTPKLIDSISGYAQAPKVASTGSSYAVTWRKYSGSTYDIYAAVSSGVTATATWAAPSALENQSYYAYEPKIASNGSSYAVVWGQGDGFGYSAYANVYSGATWSSAGTPLENAAGSVYFASNVAIAASGPTYMAAWDQHDGVTYSIFTNIYSGGSWTSAVAVDASSTMAYGPVIASQGAGTGYIVAWQQDNGTALDIYANIYSGGTWSAPELLDSGANTAVAPLAAPFPSGYAVAWFQDDASGNPNMYGRIYASGTWYAEAPIVQGAWKGTTYPPRMATNRDGVSLAVWPEHHKGEWRLYGSINATGSWGAPFLIDGSVFSNNTLAVSTNGSNFLILWYSSSIPFGGLVAATCTGNGILGTVEKVDVPGAGVLSFELASNGSGYAAVWSRYDGSTAYSIYSNIYSNGSWSKDGGGNPMPWLLEDGSNAASYPSIASNGSGYAVAWLQSDGTANSIYANLFTSGTWSTGGTLLETGSFYAYPPLIASNGSGYAVSWLQSDGAADHVYANIYSSGSWSTNGARLDNLSGYASSNSIASNGSGYAVAWDQFDSGTYNVYVNMYSSGSWSSGGTSIESTSEYATQPGIASNGAGYAVSWHQYDGAYYSIVANVYSSGTWSSGGTLLETTDSDAAAGRIVSNGNKYSVIWWQLDPNDLAVYDVWASLGVF